MNRVSGAGRLARWLDGMPLVDFRRNYLGVRPLARPASARSTIAYCTWESLDALLHAKPADVLTIAAGAELNVLPPRSSDELQQLFARRAGIAVRAPERHSAPLAQLARAFACDLPGQQRVIVFATAAD